jgi:hypothetical protein
VDHTQLLDAAHIVPDSEAAARMSSENGSEGSELVFGISEFEQNRPLLETRIKAFVARRTWDVSAWTLVIHQIDKTLEEALKLWTPAEDLAAFPASGR